jgi:hypothetical protein
VKIDCLVSVTATFYEKGQMFHTDDLSEDLVTFGEIETDDEDEYIRRLELDEIEADDDDDDDDDDEEDTSTIGLLEDKKDAEVLKDFIDFSLFTVGFGDAGDTYCCGIDFATEEGSSWDDEFRQYIDELTEYANKVREECNEKRLEHKSKYGPTNKVRFVIAMDYWSSQGYEGEWDSGSSLLGMVNRDDILKIVKDR